MSLSNIAILFLNHECIAIFHLLLGFYLWNHTSFLLVIESTIFGAILYSINNDAKRIKNMLEKLEATLIVDDDKMQLIPRVLHKHIIGISNDSGIFNRIHNKKRANLIIHTHGGDADSANRSSNDIMSHGNVYCYVPEYAHSAGSLIALSCNNIFMNKYASLSPIDTTLEINNEYISAYCLTDSSDRVLANQAKQYINYDMIQAMYIMKGKIDDRITEIFASGKLPHNTSFSYGFLKKLGLRVNSKIPHSVMLFHDEYKKFYRDLKRFM